MDRTNFIWMDRTNSLDNNNQLIISKWTSVINQLNNSFALKRISVIDIVHFSKISRYKMIRDLINNDNISYLIIKIILSHCVNIIALLRDVLSFSLFLSLSLIKKIRTYYELTYLLPS